MPQNNTQFVSTTLMQSNVVGPMAELIVITAIDNYTKQVVEQGKAAVVEQMKNTMFHGEAWFRGCKEIQDKLNARCTMHDN